MNSSKNIKCFLVPLVLSIIILCSSGALAAFNSVGKASDYIAKKFNEMPQLKGKKMVIVGFRGLTSGDELSPILEDEMTVSFVKLMPGQIATRSRLNEIVSELRDSHSDIFDSANRKRIGRLSSADIIITGTHRIEKRNVIISVQAIDIETGLTIAYEKTELKYKDAPFRIDEAPAKGQIASYKPKSYSDTEELPMYNILVEVVVGFKGDSAAANSATSPEERAYDRQQAREQKLDGTHDEDVGIDVSNYFYFSKYAGLGLGLEIVQEWVYKYDYDDTSSPLGAQSNYIFLPYVSLSLRYTKHLSIFGAYAVGDTASDWRVGAKLVGDNIALGIAWRWGKLANLKRLKPKSNEYVPMYDNYIDYKTFEITIGYQIDVFNFLY
jgi:hypothetical protein